MIKDVYYNEYCKKNIEYLKEDYIEKNKDFKFKVSPAKVNVEDILIEHYEKNIIIILKIIYFMYSFLDILKTI